MIEDEDIDDLMADDGVDPYDNASQEDWEELFSADGKDKEMILMDFNENIQKYGNVVFVCFKFN